MNDQNKTPTEPSAPALSVVAGSAWISVADRLPTENDSNEFGEVWWWMPRYASHGAQRDQWYDHEGATHWMPCDGYEDSDEQPRPPSSPNTKLTDAPNKGQSPER